MVFPDRFRIGLAAVELGRCPHGEADQILYQDDNGRDDAKVGVNGVEVVELVDNLVVLDDDNAGHEEEKPEEVERGVNPLSDPLLVRRMGRLKNQDRLHQRQDSEGLGQGMAGEKDDRLGQDADPDNDEEQDDASLGEDSSTCLEKSAT